MSSELLCQLLPQTLRLLSGAKSISNFHISSLVCLLTLLHLCGTVDVFAVLHMISKVHEGILRLGKERIASHNFTVVPNIAYLLFFVVYLMIIDYCA